jgi:hypothetical protein
MTGQPSHPATSGAGSPIPAAVRPQGRTRVTPFRVAAMVVLTALPVALLLFTRPESGMRVPRSPSSVVPAKAESLVSRAVGAGSSAFWISRTAEGLRARNARQGLTARFSSLGAVVSAQGSRLTLSLAAIGRGATSRVIRPRPPQANRNRVEYQLGRGVVQWFANGPLGVEQGFSLRRSPAGRGRLVNLVLKPVSPGMRPALDAARHDVEFLHHGHVAFRYGELEVRDASGRSLPAWFALRGRRVVVRFDDRGASYPLVVDPVLETSEIIDPEGNAGDVFGHAVAISGSILAVGAEGSSLSAPGAIDVFSEPASGWQNATEVARLTASDGASGSLGSSLAMSGNAIVAGAPNTAGGGAAYVFVEPPSGWRDETESAKLTASDGVAGDLLGSSVGIDGQTVVAGADSATVATHAYQGAAYVFSEPVTGWQSETETAKLTASDGVAGDGLGTAVAISGNTILAGAPDEDGRSSVDPGAAYVFVEPTAGWQTMTQTAKLTASDGTTHSAFGSAIALSGSTLALGAPGITPDGHYAQGAVYEYTRPNGGWQTTTQTAELTVPNGDLSEGLGVTVTALADTIIAGATGSNIAPIPGKAYVFHEPLGGWQSGTSGATLTAGNGVPGNGFAESLALADGTLVVGAGAANNQSDVGAVYVFGLVPVVGAGGGLVTGAGSELVSGSVDGRGFPVSDCHFEFGLTSGYGMSAPCAGVVGTDGAAGVSAQLVGLASGSTYHYRVVATNEFGTSYGADASFVTAGAPVARTGLASGVSRVGAVVSGSVDPEGLGLTACEFEYGTTLAYGQVAPCPTPAGGGTAAVGEVTGLSGLAAGQTYHFRLVASSAAGASMGVDESFRTLVAPAAVTGGVSQISRSAATIAGRVDPEGESVSACYFELGLTKRYGIQVRCAGRIGSGASAVRARVSGLAAGSKYHYRVVIVTPGGTTHGTDHTLTTKQPPRPVGATIPPALFGVARTYTEVIGLRVTGLRRGVRVAVGCRGGGCPFRSRVTVDREICAGHGHRCRPAPNRIDLTPEFKRRRLRPGTVLTIEITEPDTIGKSYTFTVKAKRFPVEPPPKCIQPGGRPTAC